MSAMKPSQAVLPNFLIVGAGKCGTTSLYHYLQQHPEVYMSPVKEPKFFSNCTVPGLQSCSADDSVEPSAVGSFEEYCGLFEKGIGKKAVGEASVETLLYWERTIPAIRHYLGDPRIVIILRDPVQRAYSAYNYEVRDGRETLSFKDALIAESQRRQKLRGGLRRYREIGLYARRVRAFQENFSRVQVLLYDDLKKDPQALLRSLYAFLQVDPAFVPETGHRHNVSGIPRWPFVNDLLFVRTRPLHTAVRAVGGALFGADRWARMRERLRSPLLHEPGPMDREAEQELRRYFREDILELQGYIGRDLSAWLK